MELSSTVILSSLSCPQAQTPLQCCSSMRMSEGMGARSVLIKKGQGQGPKAAKPDMRRAQERLLAQVRFHTARLSRCFSRDPYQGFTSKHMKPMVASV
jgi:hypothetical protein